MPQTTKMTHSFGVPAGHHCTNIHPPGPVWVLFRLVLYSSPFWTAALWLTRDLLPDRRLDTLTTGSFLAFTAIFYALFRILRQHIHRLKANRSPDWIVWYLQALPLLSPGF